MKSTITLSTLLAVATATPFLKARSLDISAYKAVPTVPVTGAPAGNTVTASITYNPSSVASAAIAAATSSVAIVNRRHKRSSCSNTCAVLAAGNGPSVNSPDTAAAFQADQNLADAALNAVTPPDYALVDGFQNVDAAAQSATYLTYISDSVTSYDPAICANACNNIQGCTSFNICKLALPMFCTNTNESSLRARSNCCSRHRGLSKPTLPNPYKMLSFRWLVGRFISYKQRPMAS